jgi:hypothetical protein
MWPGSPPRGGTRWSTRSGCAGVVVLLTGAIAEGLGRRSRVGRTLLLTVVELPITVEAPWNNRALVPARPRGTWAESWAWR